MSDIISAVYSRRYRLKPRPPVAVHDHYLTSAEGGFLEQGRGFIARHVILVLISAVVILKIFLALTYYNRLIFEETNMMASYSNMSVLVQRRNDIGRNLIQAIHYYSQYEERVYSKIVKLRTTMPQTEENEENEGTMRAKAPPPPTPPVEKDLDPASVAGALSSGAGLLPSLPKIMAVAEQYPDLKSELNYTVLLTALVDLEKDLAAQRIQFNSDANTYTTTLLQFPSNIFAWIFGFKSFPYFESTQEAKEFKIAE